LVSTTLTVSRLGILHHHQFAVTDSFGRTQVNESPYLGLDIAHRS